MTDQPRNLLVRTESGSIYEVRHDRKAVRRLTGLRDPTDRVGDGWRVCKDVVIGTHMVILWPDNVPLMPGSPPLAKPATRTSEVVNVTKKP